LCGICIEIRSIGVFVMTKVPGLTKNRVLIIGGGIAGLSASVRLAQAGLPVTLFEESTLGHGASTRNQGWLHSGGWFAKENIHLASRCYKSLQQTIQCCPDCLECYLSRHSRHFCASSRTWEKPRPFGQATQRPLLPEINFFMM